MTLIGRLLLSCPPAWDHRWRTNLWPVLPAHRPGASSASALSCSVQAAASGPPCHLGSSWHPESVPIWQPGTDMAGGAVTVTCLLSAVSFCTDKHAEKSYTRTQRHTAAWARVGKSTSWFFSSPLGGLLAWKWIKDFDFYTWNPPVFFLFVCSCVQSHVSLSFDLHLLFSWMCGWVRLRARSHDCFGFKRSHSQRNWQRPALLRMAVPLMKQYLS